MHKDASPPLKLQPKISTILFCLFVLAIPIIIWNGTLTAVDIKLLIARFLILALSIVVLINGLKAKTVEIPSMAFILFFVFFIGYSFAICLCHPYADWEIWGDSILSVLFFFEAVLLLRNQRETRIVLLTWQLCICVVCAYYLLQRAGMDFVVWHNADPHVIGSTFTNRNLMAYFLVSAFPYSIYLLLTEKGNFQWFAGFSCALSLGTLLSCFSRISIVIIAVSIPLYFLFFQHRNKQRKIRKTFLVSATIAAICICSAGAFALFYTHKISFEKLNAISHARLQLWKDTLLLIKDSMWLGHGAGCFAKIFPAFKSVESGYLFGFFNPAFNSHNEYLELLCEYGIIGLIGFIALIIVATGINGRSWLKDKSQIDLLFFSGMSLFGSLVFSTIGEVAHMFVCTAFSWLSLAIFFICGNGTLPLFRLSKRGYRVFLFVGAFWCLCLISAFLWYSRTFLSNIYTQRATRILAIPAKQEEAMINVAKALSFSSHYVYALYQRAYLFTEKKDYKKALADYETIQITDPYFENIHFNKGVLFNLQGDFNKAITCLTVTVRLYPTFLPGVEYLAISYYQTGHYSECIAWCDHLLKLDPQNTKVQQLISSARLLFKSKA
jgi:O-antigen ligase